MQLGAVGLAAGPRRSKLLGPGGCSDHGIHAGGTALKTTPLWLLTWDSGGPESRWWTSALPSEKGV